MSLIVLFGLPGAGKTYVGKVITTHFPYYFYDGDEELPQEMKVLIQQQIPISSELRDQFFNKIIDRLTILQKSQPNLVLAQTFIKEKYRELVRERFPEATFVLVETETNLREKRLLNRVDYPLDLPYSRIMAANFEPPHIPHQVIINNSIGEENLIRQLKNMLYSRE